MRPGFYQTSLCLCAVNETSTDGSSKMNTARIKPKTTPIPLIDDSMSKSIKKIFKNFDFESLSIKIIHILFVTV